MPFFSVKNVVSIFFAIINCVSGFMSKACQVFTCLFSSSYEYIIISDEGFMLRAVSSAILELFGQYDELEITPIIT